MVWMMNRLLAIKMTKVPISVSVSHVENEVIQTLCMMENVGYSKTII